MEFRNGEAYELDKRIVFYEDGVFFDDYRDVSVYDLDELIRVPSSDWKYKAYSLHRKTRLAVMNRTYVKPEEKAILKVYPLNSVPTVGILMGEYICCSNDDIYYHAATGYEKIDCTPEQIELLNEFYRLQKKLNKLFSDRSRLLDDNSYPKEKELELLRKTFELKDNINESFGIVIKPKFVKMFESFLTPEMKNEMKSKNYEVVEHPAVPCLKEYFAIQRYIEIDKNVDSNLIEYDKKGDAHFIYCSYDVERFKKSCIEEYSKELTTYFEIKKEVNVSNDKTLFMLEYYLLTTDHYCKEEAKRMANNFCRKLEQC